MRQRKEKQAVQQVGNQSLLFISRFTCCNTQLVFPYRQRAIHTNNRLKRHKTNHQQMQKAKPRIFHPLPFCYATCNR